MWNIKRVKVPQPLRNTEQLPHIRKIKLATCSRYGNSAPHQRHPRHTGMRGYELTDVSLLPPLVYEGKLKDRHVDAAKR